MPEPLKLMAVFPHPDDETLGMGGTLAKYAAEGVETYLVCATRGERGWTGAEADNPGLAALGRIREAELRAAARVLGLREVALLDHLDGDVDRAEPARIIAQIVGHLRRARPQVVVTVPPDGAYGHPDHVALSQFATAAVVCAADAGYADPHDQPAHRVAKLYFMVDSRELAEMLQSLFGFSISMEVDGVVRQWVPWDEWQITTPVPTADYWLAVVEAMRCHQSQLPSLGRLPDLPEADQRRIWGLGNFYRAFSLVNGGRRVETDLFEGLR